VGEFRVSIAREHGVYEFNGIFSRNPSTSSSTGEGFADFLLGLPDTWGVSTVPTHGVHRKP
jgi:hypothetical protein